MSILNAANYEAKKVWRVASSTNLPYQEECALKHFKPTRDCFYPGIQPELLQFIAARLNVTLQIIPHSPYDFGDPLANGTWTGSAKIKTLIWHVLGILGAINAGTVDTGSLLYLNYGALNKNFAVTNPCIYLSNFVVAPADYASPLRASLLLVNVYQPYVWLMCIASCTLCTLTAIFITTIMQRSDQK